MFVSAATSEGTDEKKSEDAEPEKKEGEDATPMETDKPSNDDQATPMDTTEGAEKSDAVPNGARPTTTAATSSTETPMETSDVKTPITSAGKITHLAVAFHI